ncbi:hypothetical protein [Paraburkholderia sp. EG304]|uniref:hypothetical protein n=1 Tax=Paraburkholderia sp. EG304 TaxID=3237015 RepID=UPI00397A7C88
MKKEVSKDDILRAIKRALGTWVARPVTFCETPFVAGAGFPSVVGEEFVGLCWDETSVDGALSQTCENVREALSHVVGSVVLDPKSSFSKRHSKDDRPFIETFYRTLASRAFQRLSNTTGSSAKGRAGSHPEDVAITSRFQYEYAEELLEVLIANYNGTPHSGISFRTPLEYAKFLYENTPIEFRKADQTQVQSFFSVRKRCRVRGGAASGRMSFVEFAYALYSNELLQSRQDLVGKDIWVISHLEDDARVALASTLDGASLGVLRAAPPWHLSPHSLMVRTSIMQTKAKLRFLLIGGGDAIEQFLDYVESQPKGKLPVHPAYLEARRILGAAARQPIGDTLLDSALEKIAALDQLGAETGRPMQGRSLGTSPVGSDANPQPPRRIAAGK